MIPNNQFFFNNKSEEVSLLQTWYNALSVKPSAQLWTDLNALANGLNEDGNWTKLDLFSLVAGMETNEQRLKPLITVTGLDIVATGGSFSNAGFANGGVGYIDLNYNPNEDSINYTLLSAYYSTYVDNITPSVGYITNYIMGAFNDGGFTASGSTWGGDFEASSIEGVINGDISATAGIVDSNPTSYYFGVVNSSNSITCRVNGSTDSATAILAEMSLPSYSLFGGAANDAGTPYISDGGGAFTTRHYMAGAGTVNQEQIRTRLNTFYTARGI